MEPHSRKASLSFNLLEKIDKAYLNSNYFAHIESKLMHKQEADSQQDQPVQYKEAIQAPPVQAPPKREMKTERQKPPLPVQQ